MATSLTFSNVSPAFPHVDSGRVSIEPLARAVAPRAAGARGDARRRRIDFDGALIALMFVAQVAVAVVGFADALFAAPDEATTVASAEAAGHSP